MNILTIKEYSDTWCVNGNIFIPKASNNQEVQDAINGTGDYEGNPITVEPEFTETELQTKQEADFRLERNKLLQEADIEINKLVDNNQDATAWREYRQALRDATISWVLPEIPQ